MRMSHINYFVSINLMVILQVQLFTHVICFLLHPNYIINIENGKEVYIAMVIMTDKF